jgi:hypothetical protein
MLKKPLFSLTPTSVFVSLPLCLVATGLFASQAQATFITMSPDPFQGSTVVLSSAPSVVATPPLGFANTFTINNFNETSSNIVSGNQVVVYTADFNVTFFSDSTLTTPVGSAVLPGNFQATILGRTNPFSTGTWGETIDLATFTSTVNGQSLQTQLNPGLVTTGSVTVTADPGVGEFTIDNTATVHAQQVINGTTSDVPTLSASAEPTPTPPTVPVSRRPWPCSAYLWPAWASSAAVA